MKIIVEKQTGEGGSCQFDVVSSTTVRELKLQFAEKNPTTQKDFENMYFTIGNDIIDILDEDTRRLCSYGVEEGSHLRLNYANISSRSFGSLGIRFADVSKSESLQSLEFSQSAPYWRKVTSGFFLEGTCENEDCEAYDKDVIMSIGYATFDLVKDPSKDTTKCPMCKKFVQPTNCGFNNCWWRFEGLKQEGKKGKREPIKCSSEWKQIGNAYHYFDPSSAEEVNWKQLVIECVKRKPTTS